MAFLTGEVGHRQPYLLSQNLLVGQFLRQAGNGSVFSRLVLSLKVGYRPLQTLQQPPQSRSIVAPVYRGAGGYLRPIHRLDRQIH